MPAAFAHDLYGRRVYETLAPEIKRLIRKERDCFYLGLHGPDILFFYRAMGQNRVNQKGVRLHKEAAENIFIHGLLEIEEAQSQEEKDALRAYLLGFACHFSLDHHLHGFINETERNTALSHGDIETELDRRLLEREGLRPLRTNCTCHLKITKKTKLAAGRILKEDPLVIAEAICSFRSVNRLFINSGRLMKQLIFLILRAGGKYDEIQGMIMRKQPVEGSREITDKLEPMFYEAVEPGREILTALWESFWGRGPLPARFRGNFEGNMF